MNKELTKRILKKVDYDKYHPKVRKDIRKAIDLTIAEKDAQKDLFIKKLKKKLFWENEGFTYVKPANKICGIIDKLNKEVFGNE